MDGRLNLTVLAIALVACGSTIKDAAREASEGAVEESVQELTTEQARPEGGQEARQGDESAQEPETETAAHELSDQVTEGILRSLESPRAQAQIAALTRTAVDAAARQTLATLSSNRSQAQLGAVSGGVVDSIWRQTAASMKTDLGPAFGAMVRDELGRGVASALNEPLRGTLGHTAQNLAFHAVLGANDGVASALSAGETQSGLRSFWQQGRSWLWLAAISAGLLALALLFGAVIAVARATRVRSEITRLETTALLLATAMRERSASAEASELVALVQQALENSAHSHGRGRVLGMLGLRRTDHH